MGLWNDTSKPNTSNQNPFAFEQVRNCMVYSGSTSSSFDSDFDKLREESTGQQGATDVSSDEELLNYPKKHDQQRIVRDTLYTELCDFFVKNWRWRSSLIEVYKVVFLLILFIGFYRFGQETLRIVQEILSYTKSSDVSHELVQLQTDSFVTIITAFVSFTTAIIAVPLAIAKYLFNKDENKDAVEIIKAMANTDAGGTSICASQVSDE